MKEISKGDLPGHKFRGNQWLDGEGNFAVGGNRPAAQPVAPTPKPKMETDVMRQRMYDARQRLIAEVKARAEAQKPEPAPAPPQSRFTGFTSTKVAAPIGDKMKLGGAYNNGIQTYRMEDGSRAAGKETRDYMATREVAASLIGKAVDAPIRECIPLPGGTPEQVMMPWVEGDTMNSLPRDQRIFSVSNSEIDSKCCPEVAKQLYEMRFFDTLIGNEDRWANMGNVMVVTPGKETADLRDPTTKIIGIDHGILSRPDKQDFRSEATACGISNERITEISNGINALAKMPGLDEWTTIHLGKIQDALQYAFPDLVK
jgi:hypothetical protein